MTLIAHVARYSVTPPLYFNGECGPTPIPKLGLHQASSFSQPSKNEILTLPNTLTYVGQFSGVLIYSPSLPLTCELVGKQIYSNVI